jgi:hypothetical protein
MLEWAFEMQQFEYQLPNALNAKRKKSIEQAQQRAPLLLQQYKLA